jgi:hypothetical protein
MPLLHFDSAEVPAHTTAPAREDEEMPKYLHIVPMPTDIGWVEDKEKATADYHTVAEATQRRLKDLFGLETILEEIPDQTRHQMQSKWVICKTDS